MKQKIVIEAFAGGRLYREQKKTKRIGELVSAIYWIIVVAAYLAYSFHANAWEHSWYIYAVAAFCMAPLQPL